MSKKAAHTSPTILGEVTPGDWAMIGGREVLVCWQSSGSTFVSTGPGNRVEMPSTTAIDSVRVRRRELLRNEEVQDPLRRSI